MSDQARISLRNVSKSYRLYDSPSSKLKQLLWGGLKQYYAEFPALRDIDLEIEPGATVGIIGHNGAGKSTLLELVSSISAPTRGTVDVRGNVLSLLELGAGLNPEFTGRENVFLYGCVLGMGQIEVERKFDAIVAFAEIGRFIEQPVRTYSNGMLMRLAFAVAAHVEADIVIFDEVLAVGDGRFQHKCFSHIRELRRKGVTVLLVSHNLDTITSLCSRVVILDHGRKYFDGGPQDAFWAYCRLVSLPPEASASAPTDDGAGGWKSPMGTGEARFLKTELLDDAGRPRTAFSAGESCEVRFRFISDRDIPRGSIGVVVQNQHALTAYGVNTASDPSAAFSWRAGVESEASISLDLNLAPGRYYISIVLNLIDGGHVVSLCSLESFAEISITEPLGAFGISNLFARFK